MLSLGNLGKFDDLRGSSLADALFIVSNIEIKYIWFITGKGV
jgi:hypothetical protein